MGPSENIKERAAIVFHGSKSAGLQIRDGIIVAAAIALGGVAPKPWRVCAAEQTLCGERPGPNVFDEAARVAMANAEPLPQNTFKVDLGKHAVKRALTLATTARQLKPGVSG